MAESEDSLKEAEQTISVLLSLIRLLSHPPVARLNFCSPSTGGNPHRLVFSLSWPVVFGAVRCEAFGPAAVSGTPMETMSSRSVRQVGLTSKEAVEVVDEACFGDPLLCVLLMSHRFGGDIPCLCGGGDASATRKIRPHVLMGSRDVASG